MTSITFAQAWRRYRDAERLLPAKPPAVTPRRVSGAAVLADEFDLIALDAWGVLNLGEAAISGARAAVSALRAAGKRLVVLSNSGSRDAVAASGRLARLGFAFAPAEILAGVDVVPTALAALALPHPVGLVADPPFPLPAITAPMLPLADDGRAYDQVSGFVFLSSDGWTPARQELLAASLARRPRPLVVGNPDIASPEPDGSLDAEPGYYALDLAERAAVGPVFCGKPFPALYARLGALHPDVAPERVLCVGDTLHTDILGGRVAGYRTLLVEAGFSRGRDGVALAAECGIWPDFIAPRL